MVSIPFPREHGFPSGFSLLVFQEDEGDSIKVSLIVSDGHVGLSNLDLHVGSSQSAVLKDSALLCLFKSNHFVVFDSSSYEHVIYILCTRKHDSSKRATHPVSEMSGSGVMVRESLELLGLEHHAPEAITSTNDGYLKRRKDPVLSGSVSPAQVSRIEMPKSGEPDHGVSVLLRLITTGSGFISPDLVESENGDRPEGSHGTVKMPTSPHGTVKDDKVPTALCGFARGSPLPAMIVGNFAGRFMGFQLNEVAAVVGTTRTTGSHKPMLSTPMNEYFELILGSDPSATVLTGLELPKSWTLEFVKNSVSTLMPAMTTRSLVQISAGSTLAFQIRLEIFIGGRVFHGSARAPVTDTARTTEFSRLCRMGRDAAGLQILQRRSLGRSVSRLAIERSDGKCTVCCVCSEIVYFDQDFDTVLVLADYPRRRNFQFIYCPKPAVVVQAPAALAMGRKLVFPMSKS